MNLLDRAASIALRWAPDRFSVFPEGLGSSDLERLVAEAPVPTDAIAPLDLNWQDTEETEEFTRSQARFQSPWMLELPTAAREAWIERTEPKSGVGRVMVLLQMWGDEGFSMRRKIANRLAARGIATWLPIHPFYGRRRVYEEGAPVRTVEDFLRMGLGAIHEARSILAHIQSRSVGIGGFSMGSGFSVGVSTTLPFPVALTLMGAAPSPAKAFTEGVLVHGLPVDLRGRDRASLGRVLDSVGALSRPVLDHHRRAVILAAHGDGFVPVEDARALAAHWEGAELRLVRGGHATLWLCRTGEMVSAIERSFERHEAREA